MSHLYPPSDVAVPPLRRTVVAQRVSVRAPARLHLGFLDLDGGLGRRFGSLGLTLEQPGTRVDALAAPDLRVEGPEADRVERYLRRAAQHFGVPATGHYSVRETVEPHIGLGSGTQLGMASAAALCALSGILAEPVELARATGRGLRSGVGIAGFDQGGFLLDGGNRGDAVAPIVARLSIPAEWSVLLLYDDGHAGLHGEAEVQAFRQLPAFTAERAATLCRVTLMQLLPALAEADLFQFGAAMTVIQNEVGDHFAPAQGGRFASPRIAAVIGWLREQGVTCCGQSSWGPTGFAVLPDEASGRALAEAVRIRFAGQSVRPALTRGRNRGADILTEPPAAPAT